MKKLEVHRHYETAIEVLSTIGGFYTSVWLVISMSLNKLFNYFSKLTRRDLTFKVFKVKKFTTGCCLKKNFNTENSKFKREAYKAARTMIQEALDVKNLIEQLCLLKTLVSFFLSPESQELAASYCLSNKIRERREKKRKIT